MNTLKYQKRRTARSAAHGTWAVRVARDGQGLIVAHTGTYEACCVWLRKYGAGERKAFLVRKEIGR